MSEPKSSETPKLGEGIAWALVILAFFVGIGSCLNDLALSNTTRQLRIGNSSM